MAKRSKRSDLGAGRAGKMTKIHAGVLKLQRGKSAKSKVHFGSALKVKFGDVVVVGPALPAEEIEKNIARSTQALERLGSGILGPGVVLRKTKGVPLYSVSEGEPGVFIRRLDDRVERGRLVNGAFEVLK